MGSQPSYDDTLNTIEQLYYIEFYDDESNDGGKKAEAYRNENDDNNYNDNDNDNSNDNDNNDYDNNDNCIGSYVVLSASFCSLHVAYNFMCCAEGSRMSSLLLQAYIARSESERKDSSINDESESLEQK